MNSIAKFLKFFLTYICFSIVVLNLSNCSRDPSCAPTRHQYYFIKNEEKSILPYKGFDTIKLIDSKSVVHTFFSTSKDSALAITTSSTSPDCATNIIIHHEYTSLDFTSSTYPSNIEISLRQFYQAADVRVKFEKKYYLAIAYSLPLIPPRPNYYNFDTLSIQGKVYYNIRKLHLDGDIDEPAYALFNREYGLLQVTTSKGEVLNRIPN